MISKNGNKKYLHTVFFCAKSKPLNIIGTYTRKKVTQKVPNIQPGDAVSPSLTRSAKSALPVSHILGSDGAKDTVDGLYGIYRGTILQRLQEPVVAHVPVNSPHSLLFGYNGVIR